MIGNKNKDDFTLTCCWCGSNTDLNQVAFRDTQGKVIGYTFLCSTCLPTVDGKYEIVIKEV